MRFPELTSITRGVRYAMAGAMIVIGSPVSTLALAGTAHAAQITIAPGGNANPSDNITICHANNDDKKPYVQNSPNANGTVQGHADHTGPVWNPTLKSGKGNSTSWGDIIPPFTYNDKNGNLAGSYPGLNWDAAGQAIWNNGCSVVSSLKVVKNVVNTGGGTKQSSDFTMTVDGTNVSQTSFAGSAAGTTVTLDPGSFTADEVADASYTESKSGDCSGSILAGQNLTCTITNTFVAPVVQIPEHTLTVKKVVVGSPADPSDFQIHVTKNGTDINGSPQAGSSDPGNIYPGLEGTYGLSETVTPGSDVDLSDFTTTFSDSCANAVVTIDKTDVDCTITNTFIAGHGGTVDEGGNGGTPSGPGQGGTSATPGSGNTPSGGTPSSPIAVLGASTGPVQVLGAATLPATGAESDLPWAVSLIGAIAAYWVSRRRLRLAESGME